MYEAERAAVLDNIAGKGKWRPEGQAKYRAAGRIIHTRFCRTNPKSPKSFKFNINRNTLSADYELWICGTPKGYYLIPRDVIAAIYHDPDAYVDQHHPDIRVVSVDIIEDRAVFGAGGKSVNLAPFFHATLINPAV